MRAEDFESCKVGEIVPIQVDLPGSGERIEHIAYIPLPLPDDITLSTRTYKLLAEADRAIGRLDAATDHLPRPELLIRPALYKEAVSTSALEGTYAPLFDVLEGDYIEEPRQTAEVREIRNYLKAAVDGVSLIASEPLRFNLVKRLQATLVAGTRGDGYSAGRLRTTHVFIGEHRSGIRGARFVPPPPGDRLRRGVDDWDKWINRQDDIPLLVRVAMAHYQFETLHPFTDGNGRIGRLTMVLQLISSKALRYPILNLSAYLEPNKEQYKDLLLQVSQTGEYDPWIQFFAQGVREQAERSRRRIEDLMACRDHMLESLKAQRAKGVVLELIDDLVGHPIITPSHAAALHGVTYPPANNAIARLIELGFLEEITGRSYGRVFACRRIMEIVDAE
ncbi:Fic family protein [Occultella kanbiaonis]|uniref:Fic family protein n=1 Tax=Occultella kanbiaonis TaxID=2675754 RepID=UPI001A98FD2D|nr:Fic/DOC family N-terminal domain-containing protein [Occultella kanbiaonis]